MNKYNTFSWREKKLVFWNSAKIVVEISQKKFKNSRKKWF